MKKSGISIVFFHNQYAGAIDKSLRLDRLTRIVRRCAVISRRRVLRLLWFGLRYIIFLPRFIRLFIICFIVRLRGLTSLLRIGFALWFGGLRRGIRQIVFILLCGVLFLLCLRLFIRRRGGIGIVSVRLFGIIGRTFAGLILYAVMSFFPCCLLTVFRWLVVPALFLFRL